MAVSSVWYDIIFVFSKSCFAFSYIAFILTINLRKFKISTLQLCLTIIKKAYKENGCRKAVEKQAEVIS